MSSSLSEPTRRRPASARKGVERWTADIEQRLSAEIPRGGYDAHEKRFARVPWREIPTRTPALEAHEFVNPTAYVVRASDAFVYPGHFLDKARVLEADKEVRAANEAAREEATRARAERARADARLRRETIRTRSARRSRREESIVEDIVRPRASLTANDGLGGGGVVHRESGEYRRLGARDRQLSATPAGGRRAPDAPVAVTFKVVRPAHDSPEAARTSGKNQNRSIGVSNVTGGVSSGPTKTHIMRPRKVTPGERVALVHGPGAPAPAVPSKKTNGARGGALAARTQRFGYSFDVAAAGDETNANVDETRPSTGGETGFESRGESEDDRESERATRPPRTRPQSASAAPARTVRTFAARTATLDERLRWAAARRPAGERPRPFSARPERDLASRAAIGAGRVPTRALRNPTNAIAVSYPPRETPDRRRSEKGKKPLRETTPNRPASASREAGDEGDVVGEGVGEGTLVVAIRPGSVDPKRARSTKDAAAPVPRENDNATRAAPHMASSLAELELGARGASGLPAAFVFGTRRDFGALEASESVAKFGEFARGFRKHEGAWATGGQVEPRRPTWR